MRDPRVETKRDSSLGLAWVSIRDLACPGVNRADR